MAHLGICAVILLHFEFWIELLSLESHSDDGSVVGADFDSVPAVLPLVGVTREFLIFTCRVAEVVEKACVWEMEE